MIRLRIVFGDGLTLLPCRTADVVDRKCMIAVDLAKFINLADLQIFIIKKYCKKLVLNGQPVCMSISGCAVDTAENVSILRDNDEVCIHIHNSRGSKRTLSHTPESQHITSKYAKHAVHQQDGSSSSDSSDSDSSDSDSSVVLAPNNRIANKCPERSSTPKYPQTKVQDPLHLSPSLSLPSTSSMPSVQAIWKLLNESKKDTSAICDPPRRRSTGSGGSHYGPGQDSIQKDLINSTSDAHVATIAPMSIPAPVSIRKDRKNIISAQTQNAEQKKTEYQKYLTPSSSVANPSGYEKFPLIGIESAIAGNRIVFQVSELCELAREPRLSEFKEGIVVGLRGYILSLIISDKQLLENLDGESLSTIDIRSVTCARLLSDSHSVHQPFEALENRRKELLAALDRDEEVSSSDKEDRTYAQ